MRRTAFASTVATLFALAGCGSNQSTTTPLGPGGILPNGHRPHGQTSFETPVGGSSFPQAYERSPGDADQAGAGENGGQSQQPRTIEESDIYKLDGKNLYVLNRYRGLQIIDISDLDAPKVIGHAPIFGYPKDMYVRDGFAYVIVSDYWTFWRDAEAADGVVEPFWGSQLRIVDVTDVFHPKIAGAIDLKGDCGDSRIVGDVMYLVSSRYSWWYNAASTDDVDKTTVLSVNISDPKAIKVVDSVDFPRNGWDHHIYVNEEAIYLAASAYVGYDAETWVSQYRTELRIVDISDSEGAIALRGGAVVNGSVEDRWAMDVYGDVLRVASGTGWGNGEVYLTTFDVSNPDAVTQLGQVTLKVDENLQSARFDGDRGYLVTYRQIDPLFAFDLSDPANPVQLGELEMSGWLDFMVPAGDRLVALGHDEGASGWALAVSLIDVSGKQPALLSRVMLDGAWGWVPSSNDDFAKVFRTLPEVNLILFPFQAWDPEGWRYVGGVQLIDYFHDSLAKRGLIGDAGWVERGVVNGPNTVLTISSQIFQIMDIADRDNPRLRGRLELSRNVTDFALLGENHTAQLGGDWYLGDTNLTITPIADPDATEPTASLHVPAPFGRLFVNGAFAYVTSVVQTKATEKEPAKSATHIQVVDLTQPASPVERGTLDLPEVVWGSYGRWYWGWGDEVIQVNGSTLAFHHFSYDYYPLATAEAGGSKESGHRIYLVDLSDPDQPRLASSVSLPDVSWAWGLRSQGSHLLLSSYEYSQHDDRWFALYHLQLVDIRNLDEPMALEPISIPGWLVGTSETGPYIYTVENWWNETDQQSQTAIHALELADGLAYLQSSTTVEGYLNNLEVAESAAFAVVYDYSQTVVTAGEETGGWQSRTDLVSFDLSDAANIHEAGRTAIPDTWGWLRKVAGNRAFVDGGAGIFCFRVDDIALPTFEQFFRTYGWVQDIVVHGDTAFLPSGYYGVQVVDLTASR